MARLPRKEFNSNPEQEQAQADAPHMPRNKSKTYTRVIKPQEFFDWLKDWRAGKPDPMIKAMGPIFHKQAKAASMKRLGIYDDELIADLEGVAWETLIKEINKDKIPEDNPVGAMISAVRNQMSLHLFRNTSALKISEKTVRLYLKELREFEKATEGMDYADRAAYAREKHSGLLDLERKQADVDAGTSLYERILDEESSTQLVDTIEGNETSNPLLQILQHEEALVVQDIFNRARLSSAERFIIYHRYISDDQVPHKELAERMGLSVYAAKHLQSRAIEKLKIAKYRGSSGSSMVIADNMLENGGPLDLDQEPALA